MAIDYEQIRKDNIEEYGKGTRHLEVFERLYSDGTHFIFELLQNAEDAWASRIKFALFRDRLEVCHDGRPFNENDVRGVCGVGESTKADDLTQIGRFGIGFKSVYAFTRNPVIHCRDEHFQIKNYVRPHAVDRRAIEDPWTTLFIIPFDKADISRTFAVSEIANRLRCLSARTLLFLAHVDQIEYSIADDETGKYRRHMTQCVGSQIVAVTGERSGMMEREYEEWLVFQRVIINNTNNPVVGSNGTSVPPVQIAFLLDEEDAAKKKKKAPKRKRDTIMAPLAGKRIVPLPESHLVVFFSTEKDSRLGFLIQGPYRTTPARDNIPQHDEWNRRLVRETATLLIDLVLPQLKDMKLLTVSAFESLPIKLDDFPEDGFFFPIADACRSALKSNELLPAVDGAFVSGERAVLGRGEELRNLLGSDQLQLLFDLNRSVKWLSSEITSDNAPDLRSYLCDELSVLEITPERFVAKITAEFMDRQSDDWVANFYSCMLSWESLWKSRREPASQAGPRNRPFLRLEDGTHVTPFDMSGNPNAYLPVKDATQLPIVRRCVAANESSRQFLIRLGLSEPDIAAVVIEEILPLYANSAHMPSVASNMKHMQMIIAAWSTNLIDRKAQLKSKLRETLFVLYKSSVDDKYKYEKPSKMYFDNADLRRYFRGNKSARFVAECYSSDANILLSELGVVATPRCIEVPHGDPPKPEYTTREKDVRIRNYKLDGLGEFLEQMGNHDDGGERRDMAALLWKYLIEYAESDEKVFRATRHYFYYEWKSQTYDSNIVKMLKDAKWIPTSSGQFVKPAFASVDQLPKEFERSQKLISVLNIQPDSTQRAEDELQQKRSFAKQLGIRLEDADFICRHRDDFEHFRKVTLERLSHQEAIADMHSRNRERRRAKLREREECAPVKRTVLKLRAVPEFSRSVIDRDALFAFYHDDDQGVVFCQMCLDVMPFVKRNGEEYGECVDLFTKMWADANYLELKVMTSLNLVLCPVCSEIYREYVHKDIERQAILFKCLTNGGVDPFVVCDSGIRRDKKGCVLHFNQTHLQDVKAILDCMRGRDV